MITGFYIAQLALFLAEADPAPQLVKDWLSVALYILGIIAVVLTVLVLWKQWREKPSEMPNPVVVKSHEEFVPVPIYEKAIAELKAAQAKDTDEIKKELLRHGARRAEIYKQNEEHGKAIAALQAETKSQTRTIHHLGDQIDRLPEKIKNLLFPNT